MKQFIFLLLSVLCLSAYSQTIMSVYMSNGSVVQVPTTSVDSVAFSATPPPPVMNIFLQNGSVISLLISDIDSITYAAPVQVNTPTIITSPISNITANSAVSGGNILYNGGASVTARGVCWSTSPNPTTANAKTSNGTGTGSFTSNLTGLSAGVTYYVRAYATNSAGTAYGNELSFTTTAVVPTLSTTAITSITSTTANSGGNITSDGGASVTVRGVCWSTSPNPTTANAKTSNGTGTGSFSSNLTGLSAGVTYYVRAYATNSAGTAYGNELIFTTTAVVPTLTTTAITSITSTTANSGGNITSDGGASVTARGVCWSTSPNPTTANAKTSNGTGTGSFTSNLTGLTAGVTYYVRAYATNSAGTAYGNELSFNTTAVVPTLTTSAITSITSTTANSGGNITSDGGASVTVRGVCWSTSPNPTTANAKTSNGTGTGSFTSNLTGLSAGVTYYVRAYATNSVGIAYGNELSFSTLTSVGPCNGVTTVTDIDGNVYNTVEIGNQCWLKENLKTTKYNDGGTILHLPGDPDWENATQGAWCYYFNDSTVNDVYGKLYNWKAASSAKLCPSGWQVPAITDWDELILYIDPSAVRDTVDGSMYSGTAGGELKSTGTLEAGTGYWTVRNDDATNSTGFTAHPGGFRQKSSGGGHGFDYMGMAGFWWSNTPMVDPIWAWGLDLFYGIPQVYTVVFHKQYDGVSVRCIKME